MSPIGAMLCSSSISLTRGAPQKMIPTTSQGNGPDPNTYQALRTANSVFVLYDDGEQEYYDLTTDPYEMNNTVSSLSPNQVQLYKNTIAGIANCHNAVDCWAAQHMQTP